MHIIVFTSSHKKSGGARQALYLAEGMAERGHTVHFFAPQDGDVAQVAGQYPFWRGLGPANTWRSAIEAAMPRNGEPCVVHAFHNLAVKRVAWWGLFWRKKAVVVAHRGVLYRPNNPLPYWSPGMDCFLVNSAACARVLHSVGLPKRKARVVPNAVPDARLVPGQPPDQLRRELGIGAQDRVFGTVINNNPVKGAESLIRAFARAFPASQGTAAASTRLLMVGCKPELWEDLARSFGVRDRVHIVPYTEDVAAHLAVMDVFVFASLAKPAQESMPNTLLEAMRMGLPAIGSRVAAVPEVLEPCGLLYPPGDVEALAAAMTRMVDEPGLAEHCRTLTLEQAQLYTPEKRLDLLETIYRELLQEKGLYP